MATMNRYFKRREFACKCGCGFAAVDAELLAILTRLREHFGKPLIITSGCRCQHRNAFVHGVPGSLHTKAMAVDFKISRVETKDIAAILEKWFPDSMAVGVYKKHIHLGITEARRRWEEIDQP